MQSTQTGPARETRLRFVFDTDVVSFHVPANVTFGEIAQALGMLPRERYGHPVAIKMTLRPEPLPANHHI